MRSFRTYTTAMDFPGAWGSKAGFREARQHHLLSFISPAKEASAGAYAIEPLPPLLQVMEIIIFLKPVGILLEGGQLCARALCSSGLSTHQMIRRDADPSAGGRFALLEKGEIRRRKLGRSPQGVHWEIFWMPSQDTTTHLRPEAQETNRTTASLLVDRAP